MSAADCGIPRNFINLLGRLRPQLKSESIELQNSIAYLVWVSPLKSRRHWQLDDHACFTYQELDHLFGRRQFKSVNERIKIFTISANWRSDLGQTKGYKLVEDLADCLRVFFRNSIRCMKHKHHTLIRIDGKELRKIPKAVASRDMDNITPKAWNRPAVTNLIPIDFARLRDYTRELDRMIDTPQCDLFIGGDRGDYLYRFDIASRIIAMVRERDGQFLAIQRYVESKSGRLYGKDINLQTVPRSIKEVALHGLWEYDFENCHYAILQQMSARIGVQCHAIANYLDNKRSIRSTIQIDIGITADQAKTCLISLIYGARFSCRDEDAIPAQIGRDAAHRLYNHPLFYQLKEDVRKASRLVISAWPRSRMRLKNDYGKFISQSESSAKILSHLLQGAEAKMLEAVRKLYTHEILLLQHDGFASSVQLDVQKMNEQIYKTTGYLISIEETRIQLSTDLGMGKR